jgi:hypothetical protein
MPPFVKPTTCTELLSQLLLLQDELDHWFARTLMDSEVVQQYVGSDTWRVLSPNPGELLKEWAQLMLGSSAFISELYGLQEGNYDNWLKTKLRHWLIGDYCGYLRYNPEGKRRYNLKSERKVKRLEDDECYGVQMKICNVFMKFVSRWGMLDDNLRKRLVVMLHVPFDKHVLAGIKLCADELEKCLCCKAIPFGASMAYVDDEKKYDELQECVRSIAKRLTGIVEVPPIYVDVLLWNMEKMRFAKIGPKTFSNNQYKKLQSELAEKKARFIQASDPVDGTQTVEIAGGIVSLDLLMLKLKNKRQWKDILDHQWGDILGMLKRYGISIEA